MQPAYTILPLGDGALTISFGNRIDEEINRRVLSLFHRLQNFSPHILDLVPAYSSLTVFYNTAALCTKKGTAFAAMKTLLEPVLNGAAVDEENKARLLRIPVCYHEKFAPDLKELAVAKNLSVDDLIRLHTAKTYRVYFIGFLPGFAYMGTVDDRLAAPRKAVPRTEVPAGAVGIAGQQTGIYPFSSPGGWNLIGRTPVSLFDAGSEPPVLFRPGDAVQFYSITEDEFAYYQSRTA